MSGRHPGNVEEGFCEALWAWLSRNVLVDTMLLIRLALLLVAWDAVMAWVRGLI